MPNMDGNFGRIQLKKVGNCLPKVLNTRPRTEARGRYKHRIQMKRTPLAAKGGYKPTILMGFLGEFNKNRTAPPAVGGSSPLVASIMGGLEHCKFGGLRSFLLVWIITTNVPVCLGVYG